MGIFKHWKLHYWPLLTSGIFLLSFILGYLIAVVINHHVYGFYPYISDTGTIPPESCIFSQLFNMGGLFWFITVYIRYKQIAFGVTTGNIRIKNKWNTIAFWLGACMSLGMSIGGNFQETGIEIVHMVAAFMVVGIGTAYFVVQAIISRASFRAAKISYYGISKTIYIIRILLSIIMVLFFLVCAGSGMIARSQFKGKLIYHWTEDDGAFSYRLASTFSEWIVAISMLIFIATYTNEFKRIGYGGVVFSNLIADNLNDKTSLEVV